jgi:hypothetical protein
MSFTKMQEALQKEGWFVGWNLPCCQSCAWSFLPYYLNEVRDANDDLLHPETLEVLDVMAQDDHYTQVDLSKVLFNHSQDCEVYDENEEECDHCDGTGFNEDDDDDCDHCEGEGIISGDFQDLGYEPDVSVDGFVCMPPEVAGNSLFCFDGSDEGIKNLQAILPIIKESGCEIHWDGSGNSRPEISWDKQ